MNLEVNKSDINKKNKHFSLKVANRSVLTNILNSMKDSMSQQYIGIFAMLVALVVITSIFHPAFFSKQNLFNILLNSSVIALAAFGQTFVIISAGIDLSLGALAAFIGVVSADLLARGLNPLIVIISALILGVLIGALNGVVIAKFNLPPFVVTLGMEYILRGAAIAYGGGYPIPIKMDNPFVQIGSGHVMNIPMPILISLSTFLLCYIILKFTNVGRNVFAVGGNPEAAKLSGINVTSTLLFTYGICAGLAAAGGLVLAARLYTGLPSAANGLELSAIAAVVMGGTSFSGGDGSVIGSLIGALLLGVLLNSMVLFGLGSYNQLIFQGIIIILAVTYDQLRRSRM